MLHTYKRLIFIDAPIPGGYTTPPVPPLDINMPAKGKIDKHKEEKTKEKPKNKKKENKK